jgi:hypothetical protein
VLAVVARRLVFLREPVRRRVSVLREIQVPLLMRLFSVLAVASVRIPILVAQVPNAAWIDSTASKSADQSPDAHEDIRPMRSAATAGLQHVRTA